MKKKKLNPLDLDKQTIAKLDEKQLDAIAGGKKGRQDDADETGCLKETCGGSSCNGNNLQEALS